jgi:hypothetical protein
MISHRKNHLKEIKLNFNLKSTQTYDSLYQTLSRIASLSIFDYDECAMKHNKINPFKYVSRKTTHFFSRIQNEVATINARN